MLAKEIKELREAGKLVEAYDLAATELDANLENIWAKRNMSWVLYAQLNETTDFDIFLSKIDEVRKLNLPADEEMFFGNICLPVAKIVRLLSINNDQAKIYKLFCCIKDLPINRSINWYVVLFQAFHKGLKETPHYLEFADWWGLDNFKPENFQKDRLPNGKEVMAIGEQAYIAYSKHLLPKQSNYGDIIFDKDKALNFLPLLSELIDNYSQLQYPPYFKAKLLLAIGDKDNMLDALLPFARKKQNDFWVWDVLSEAFSDDPDKVFACYCKALSCRSPEEMLVNLRERMAQCFISKNLFVEAKTEIHLLCKSKLESGFKISNRVFQWQSQDWYKNNEVKKSNLDFYKKFNEVAENLLFSDVKADSIIIDYVNKEKKIANFILSDTCFGFFKYDRFFKELEIGDVLKVRMSVDLKGDMYHFYTAVKVDDPNFKLQYFKSVEGAIRISEGKSFGFVNDIYIHPSIISKNKYVNGSQVSGLAIKGYNKAKKEWSWRLLNN